MWFLVEMRTKRGRNDVCFCGSYKKYKKCHLIKINIIQSDMNLPSNKI